jgi:hypothetical protein
MSDIPLRTFSLKANIPNSSILKTQFVQSETKSGLWQICIKDIAIIFKADINIISAIQCNLVKDLKFKNETGGLESYNPTIGVFPLKGKLNEKKLIQFEKCWFLINAPNSELKLYVTDLESEASLDSNCDLYITVLMQRIK